MAMKGMKPGEIELKGEGLASPPVASKPEINQVEAAAKAQEDGVGSLTTPPQPLAAPEINQQAHDEHGGVPASLPTAAAAGAAKGVCGSLIAFLLQPFQDCYDDACCDDSCCDCCY
ncbi:hypothetical protein ACP70R_045471 [Stipagrostis hirtigluma subsp. patula]